MDCPFEEYYICIRLTDTNDIDDLAFDVDVQILIVRHEGPADRRPRHLARTGQGNG